MPKTKDTYKVWKEQRVLDAKISLIQDLVAKNTAQYEIAYRLGISEKTLIKMKRNHPDLMEAFAVGNDRLKDALINALFQKAVGMTHEEEVQTYEIVDGKKKQRIVKTKKYYPPDTEACKYLLSIKFGREFSPKKFELEIMEKKMVPKEWDKEEMPIVEEEEKDNG